jgi:hypothetical protein
LRWSIAALVGAVVAWGPVAAAKEPDRDACVQAYVDGQASRNQGRLLRARELLELCANESCPGMIKRDCTQWLADVRAATPSLVLTARDTGGADVADATAELDGRPLPLDGRDVDVDPGSHSVQLSRPGSPPVTQTVVLAEGERRRRVSATFAVPVVVPVIEAAPARLPAVSVLSGAIGLLGWCDFAVFGIVGAIDRSHSGCDVGCGSADYGRVHGELVAADVGLVVGVVATGVAVTTWLLARRGTARPVDGRTLAPAWRF